jgi:hypothetical protein
MRMTCVALLCNAGLGFWQAARALDGRYIGSFVHFDMPLFEQTKMRHLLDVGTRQVTPGALDMDLRMSLQYEDEPTVRNTSLLRSRFYGDLRGPTWRFYGQYVPWQRTTPSNSVPRRRDLQLGLEWQKRDLPQIRMNVTRADRETYLGINESWDRRAEVNYGRDAFGFNVAVRRLDTEPAGPNAVRATTDELRGGVRGAYRTRRLTLSAAYTGLYSSYNRRERERDLNTHRFNAGTTWVPTRRLVLGAQALTRWGYSADNAVAERSDIGEFLTNAFVRYTPMRDLSMEVLREYRSRKAVSGDVITDFLRVQTLYRRRMVRRMYMQTGFFYAVNLQPIAESTPNSSVFLMLDGELRRGMTARAELRASRPTQTKAQGNQWRRLLQLRTRPTRHTHLQVLWQHDQLPRYEGLQQRDRVWEISSGYQPVARLNLTGAWRALDGTGRIERTERQWSYNATWQTSARTSVGFNGSDRRTQLTNNYSKQTTTGITATWWTAREFKFNVDWRRVSVLGTGRSHTYGVTVRRNF